MGYEGSMMRVSPRTRKRLREIRDLAEISKRKTKEWKSVRNIVRGSASLMVCCNLHVFLARYLAIKSWFSLF